MGYLYHHAAASHKFSKFKPAGSDQILYRGISIETEFRILSKPTTHPHTGLDLHFTSSTTVPFFDVALLRFMVKKIYSHSITVQSNKILLLLLGGVLPNFTTKDDKLTMAVNDDEADTSDVELEGMDVDEEEDGIEDDVEEDIIVSGAAVAAPMSPAVDKKLHDAEQRDLDAARRERMELIAAESKKIQPPATKQEQLDYLMAQSDVFAHFLAGTN